MTRDLTEAENNLRRKMADHARKMTVDAGFPDPGENALPPEVLDRLWADWDWDDQLAEADQRRIVVAFFGFALGEYLVSRTSMRWSIVSDEDGDDYALVATSSDATIFPLAIVHKQIGGDPFFGSIAPALIRDALAVPSKPKPWWRF